MSRKRQCDICYMYRSGGYLVPNDVCGSVENRTICHRCTDSILIFCEKCNKFGANNYYVEQCEECEELKAIPCTICTKATKLKCCYCDKALCRSKLEYMGSKHNICWRDSYNASHRIRSRLLCAECIKPAKDLDLWLVEAVEFKKIYNIVYISRTLAHAFKKYNMHDKLFIKSIARIIVNL